MSQSAALRDAFLAHIREPDPVHVDGKWIDAEPVAGCVYCEVRPLLADIHAVWTSGNHAARSIIWALQDGYGEPGYTPPGEGMNWSGPRDSKPETIKAMHAAIHA